MSRASVVANQRSYEVNTLEPRASGDVFQAVVVARLIDGVTGEAITGQRMGTAYVGLRPCSATDGYVGLLGTPSRVFPALTLQAYVVELVIEAFGFAKLHLEVQVVAQSSFPVTFVARDLGILVLHRTPVTVEVSAYEFDPMNRPQPLAGAALTVSGCWSSTDQLDAAPDTGPLLSLRAPLSASRSTGATIDLPAVAPAAEPARALLVGAAGGATALEVSNRGGLVVGDLIGLDLGLERAEILEVAAIVAAADATSPARLELALALEHSHQAGAPAQGVPAPAPAAAVAVITAAAIEGDRTLRVDTLAGLAAGQVVRISDGVSAPEYRAVDFYEVTTDADGFGRFPPITGLAAVEVTAVSGPMNATARVSLTQPTSLHRLDLTLQ